VNPYELYLALNGIENCRPKVGRPQTNGFVERFNRTALNEFFRKAFREKLYESVEALRADLDAWLALSGATGTWAHDPWIQSTCTWRASRGKADCTHRCVGC